MCLIMPTIIGRSSAYSGGLQIKESHAQFRAIVLCSWADTLFSVLSPPRVYKWVRIPANLMLWGNSAMD